MNKIVMAVLALAIIFALVVVLSLGIQSGSNNLTNNTYNFTTTNTTNSTTNVTTNSTANTTKSYTINSVLNYSLGYNEFTAALLNNTSHPSCYSSDGEVADPSAPHGIFVSLDASGYQYNDGKFSQSALYYLLNDSRICGAEIPFTWKQLEPERGVINMSAVNRQCAPWIAAGKECAIKIFTVAYGNKNGTVNNSSFNTPGWVINETDTVPSCGGAAPTPVYYEPNFYNNYYAFMSQFTKLIENNSSIAYVRYGIGVGGELFPFKYLYNDPNQTCMNLWKKYNFSINLWQTYAVNQVNFEASLHSPKLITVGLNPLNGSYEIDDAVGGAAIQNGIGVGLDGYEQRTSIDAYNDGQECADDWCGLAVRADGKAPIYLETVSPTIPAGGGAGYLNNLAYFGLWQRAQIFELTEQEFLVADNASFNQSYQNVYSRTLTQAANVLGYSS